MKCNTVLPYDEDVIHSAVIDVASINASAKDLSSIVLEGDAEIQWLVRAAGFIDLTTLAGDDTSANVHRLCAKAKRPLSTQILNELEARYSVKEDEVRTAAICVYPSQVKTAADYLKRIGASHIPIAAVATGFPSGQYSLKSRLEEITFAIDSGAEEIDIVVNRTLALEGKWKEFYEEIVAMRNTCSTRAHLKTILAVGELGSYDNVYTASMVCMLAGADFIKTSTGKETTVNATLPVTLVMCRAIADFMRIYGVKVGYKPAGGLRTWKDALEFTSLVHNYLGPEWTNREFFRIGASSLLGDIEARIFTLLHNGRVAKPGELSIM